MRRILSISSPNHSMRRGEVSPAGKRSTMPPRRAISPRPPTSETASYPRAMARDVTASRVMRSPARKRSVSARRSVNEIVGCATASSEVTRMRGLPSCHAASVATRPADSSITSSPRSYGSALRGSSSTTAVGSWNQERSASATRSATSGSRATQTMRRSAASAAPSCAFAAWGT